MRRAARPHLRPPHLRLSAFLLLAAQLGCAAGGTGSAHPREVRAEAPEPAEAARRAGAALDALLLHHWRPADASFAAETSPASAQSGYWTSAQALEVVLDGVARDGGLRDRLVAEAFLAAQLQRGLLRDWFDDEAWMGLALVRAHQLFGDPRYLAEAVALGEDIRANAVDETCCGREPGGLWWDRAHTQKATAANAGAALLAARLFERTGDPAWLKFARSTYGWWLTHMTDPATGQVADHVDRAGVKTWWRFTYNEGTLLGAAVALHRVTGEDRYLEDARRLAAFTLAQEVRPTPAGPVLFDGAGCAGDCEQFKGIAHRHLAALHAVAPDVPGLADLLAADAQAAWSLARDARSGGFAVDWAGPPTGAGSLPATTSAAMALSAEAARLRPPSPGASAVAGAPSGGPSGRVQER